METKLTRQSLFRSITINHNPPLYIIMEFSLGRFLMHFGLFKELTLPFKYVSDSMKQLEYL